MNYFKRELVLIICCVLAIATTTLLPGQAREGRPAGREQRNRVAGIVAYWDRGELTSINRWWRIADGNGSVEVGQSSPSAIGVQPRDGMRSIEFLSERGKVTVNLPDDMAAGATISGTVSISPAGQSDQERSQSADVLNRQVLELAGQQVSVGSKRFKWTVPPPDKSGKFPLLLRDQNRREIAREALSIMNRRAAIPDSFEFPNLIERGRPFEIRGPFDGDFANTRLTIGGVEVVPLAESAGKLVARNTSSSSGIASVKCDERGVVSEGQLRTIAVRLAAPKLKLLRGEQTTLTVLVTGLKGIKEAAPLLLVNESTDVVSMGGGDRQNFTITPKAQETIDTFSTERTLTGITPGGFTISARLDTRVYDVWLKNKPDTETWFDSAMRAFRSGRDLADIAYDATNRGEEAGILADEALNQLSRARTYVDNALGAGEISESTATSLREAIARFESQTLKTKERPPVNPTALSSSHPSPTPPPSSTASPSPTANVTEGRFEPSQGVWQDDEYFVDKPSKRLTRTGPASWHAELKMIVGRRTLLFGIRDDRRARILIRGTANGTVRVPVKFRFTLVQGQTRTVIYEERRAENSVPLDGTVGAIQPFEASLLSSQGIPDYGDFTFDTPGPYHIEAELVRRDGSPMGLKAMVRGEAIETRAPKFRIVPVILSDPLSQSFELEQQAARVAGTAFLMEDFLPVRPGAIVAVAEAANDLRSIEPEFISGLATLAWDGVSFEQQRQDSLLAAVGQRFATASSLTGGEKIVVMLSPKDFALTRDPLSAAAYAVSQKVVIIQSSASHYTVAHEFIHTTPFLWSRDEMVNDCGLNYHNSADANYGNGVHIYSYGRYRLDRRPAVMGSIPSEIQEKMQGEATQTQWITQCSYWHLLNYLVGSPDPDLLLVRGYVAKGREKVVGAFDKFYELRGESELSAGPRTANGFAIVLRDRADRVVAEYPFTAVWNIPDLERERTIVPFTYRVETFPEVHRIELVGPAGVLDRKTVSANQPNVKILTPASNEVVPPAANGLPVTWRAADPDGDPLSYSVYYSPDGGRNWRLTSYEQTGTSFVIPIRGRPRDARVRVVATDGARSSTDETVFSLER